MKRTTKIERPTDGQLQAAARIARERARFSDYSRPGLLGLHLGEYVYLLEELHALRRRERYTVAWALLAFAAILAFAWVFRP